MLLNIENDYQNYFRFDLPDFYCLTSSSVEIKNSSRQGTRIHVHFYYAAWEVLAAGSVDCGIKRRDGAGRHGQHGSVTRATLGKIADTVGMSTPRLLAVFRHF
ncbi:hypothetical protein [Candidatus Symbiopectobacterium sp.]|uniref:hypothetical protein n=1 Tax=Candidatus Symbiopectobacterium sp. TaxID=2816440 RepID=UPI0025B7C219|nr:hypothetical protein [Candidatus Symbiopectobacterium sp.]